jgi:hypothetical protein
MGQGAGLLEPGPRLAELSVEAMGSSQSDVGLEQSPANTRSARICGRDLFGEFNDPMEMRQGEVGLVGPQADLAEADVRSAQAVLDSKLSWSGSRELFCEPSRLLELA